MVQKNIPITNSDSTKTIKMSMKRDEDIVKSNQTAWLKVRDLKRLGLPIRTMCSADKPHIIKKYHLPPDNKYKMIEFLLPKTKMKEELLSEISLKATFKTIKEIEHKYADGTKVLRLIVEI